MIIKREIKTWLDITDPNDMYKQDKDKMILELLSEKFNGICYNSCLITKVNKIIRRSKIYLKDTLDGHANVSVIFEVECIIYIKNEIINGCKIIKKEINGIIHAKSQYAGIQLNIQPSMSIFKEGDIFPLIVKKVRYNISQSSISVLAIPFMPLSSDLVFYNIIGSLNNEKKESLNLLLEQIQQHEDYTKKLNTDSKKIYKFFTELLQADKSYKIGKIIDMKELINIPKGILFKTFKQYNDSGINYIKDLDDLKETDKKIVNDNLIDEDVYIVISSIMNRYLSHLQTLQDFVKHYSTFTDLQKHKNVWKFYTMLKNK